MIRTALCMVFMLILGMVLGRMTHAAALPAVLLCLSACEPKLVLTQDTMSICERYASQDYAGRPTIPAQYRVMYAQCLRERGF